MGTIPKFPPVPMGVLDPGSARALPFAQPPINTRRTFQRKCLWGGGKTTSGAT